MACTIWQVQQELPAPKMPMQKRVTFSELQVLNEQLLQTLAEYISSISVLMFMNLNVHETCISSRSLPLSLSISTHIVFTVAVQ